MKPTIVTDEQIIGIEAKHEEGAGFPDLCRSSRILRALRKIVL